MFLAGRKLGKPQGPGFGTEKPTVTMIMTRRFFQTKKRKESGRYQLLGSFLTSAMTVNHEVGWGDQQPAVLDAMGPGRVPSLYTLICERSAAVFMNFHPSREEMCAS